MAPITQAAGLASEYGTSGLTAWLQNNVVTVLVIMIGIVLLAAAQKANVSKVMSVVALGFIAMMWLGMAATGTTQDVGKFLVSLFTKA